MPRHVDLLKKAKFCCICGKPLQGKKTIEHIIPKSKGGKNNIKNLSVSHRKCNEERGNKTWILPEFSITDGERLSITRIKYIMYVAGKNVRKKIE